MNRIILIYGCIAGLIVSVLMLLFIPFGKEDANYDMGELLGYLGMFIALSMIFLAVYQQRKQQGGTISFGRAFLIGLGITIISGVFYSTAWEIYLANTEADFIQEYWGAMLEKMESEGAPAAKIEETRQEMAMWADLYKNPLIRFGITLMEILPVGLLFSLTAAFVFKRKHQSSK